MATISEQLKQWAIQFSNDRGIEKDGIQREIAEAETRLALLNARLVEVEESRLRQSTFIPERDGVYQCPRCWIRTGTASALKPVAIGVVVDREIDQFVCSTCGFDEGFDV
ncbi:hypothetical protein NKI02_13240 [Mesorhizobium sp. M0730]|uniref:hypothetical protein n=1 Tax=Mesorhizobium sp. M0730 TaxID=2956991 RepID=UPI00333A3EB2